MNNSVFEPSLLFITQECWQDEQQRDVFLKQLVDNVVAFDENVGASIYWTEELEMYLWAAPQLPPWRLDRDFNLPLVQIFYRRFQPRCKIVNCRNESLAQTHPAFHFFRPDIQTAFLILMNEIARRDEDVFICLGLLNRQKGNPSYRFTGLPEGTVIAPIPINRPEDWLKHVQIEVTYWPEGREDASRFANAVRLVLQRDYPGHASLYDYSFSDRFLEDVAAETKYRVEILAKIAKRLVLSAAAARADPQLQDEFITGKNEHRFRVTPRPSSTRIHYALDKGGSITFLRFYREGQHDDGL